MDDDDDDAIEDNHSNALDIAHPETKSQLNVTSLAYKMNEIDNIHRSMSLAVESKSNQITIEEKKKLEISENSKHSNEDETKVNSSIIADDPSDLASSKQMMIQKLLDDIQSKYTSIQPLQDIDQNVNVKEIVAQTNQNKIVYNKSELMGLKVLGMSMDNIQRLVFNNEKVLLVLKSCYDKSLYFPFVSTGLKFSLMEIELRDAHALSRARATENRMLSDGSRQTTPQLNKPIDATSPWNLPVATPEELEVFASLSKKPVKSVSDASSLLGSDDTAQSNRSVDETLPFNTPVATPHESEVLASLSKRPEKSVSDACVSNSSEITIDPKGDRTEDIKARMLQRSKALKEKIGNLSK